jgi:hypothetical protein
MKINWGKVFTSKTIWISVFTVIAGIVEYIATNSGLSWGMMIVGCLGIIIRFLTSDSLTTPPTGTP